LYDCYNAIIDMMMDPRADLRIKAVCNMGLSYFPLGIHKVNADENENETLETNVLMRVLESVRTLSPDIFFDNIAVSSSMMPLVDKYHAEMGSESRFIRGRGHKALEHLGFVGFMKNFGTGRRSEELLKQLRNREKLQICLHIKTQKWAHGLDELLKRIHDEEFSENESIAMLTTISQVLVDSAIMKQSDEMHERPRQSRYGQGLFRNMVLERIPLNTFYRKEIETTGMSGPIAKMPELINLSIDLITSQSIGWRTKLYLNCAISYLIIPEEVKPMLRECDGIMDDALVLSMALYNFYQSETSVDALMKWRSHLPDANPEALLINLIGEACSALTDNDSEIVLHQCLQLTGQTITDEFLSWASYNDGACIDQFINWLKKENNHMLHTIKNLEEFRGAYSSHRNPGEVLNNLSPGEKIEYDRLYEKMGQPNLSGIRNSRSELEELRRERLLMIE